MTKDEIREAHSRVVSVKLETGSSRYKAHTAITLRAIIEGKIEELEKVNKILYHHTTRLGRDYLNKQVEDLKQQLKELEK